MSENNIRELEFTNTLPKYMLFKFGFDICQSIFLLPLAIIWFMGFGQFVCKKYAENIKCRLTDNCLYWKAGVFFREEKIIPLDKIQDVIIINGPVLDYFGINAVKIKTDSDNITLYSLNQAELFRDDLIRRQREYMMSINSSKQVEILNNILNAVTDLVTIIDK